MALCGVWKKTFKAIAVMPGVDATVVKLGASELGERIGAAGEDDISADDLEKAAGGSLKESGGQRGANRAQGVGRQSRGRQPAPGHKR